MRRGLIVMALVAAACGGGSYDGLVLNVGDGTATAIEQLTLREAQAIVDGEGVPWDAQDVELAGCRLVYPGTTAYDLRIDEAVGFDYPLDVLVAPVELIGDMGFPGVPHRVTLDGPGEFTVVSSTRDFLAATVAEGEGVAPLVAMDHWELGAFGRDESERLEPDPDMEDFEFAIDPCAVTVLALDGSGRGRDALLELVERVAEPQAPSGGAPGGSIQHLAERADWTDNQDPWQVLAFAHGTRGDLFAERLLLPAEGWRLQAIYERVDSDCYSVQMSFVAVDDPMVRGGITQFQGDCLAFADAPAQERDGWMVAADPTLVDSLEWFDNALPRDPAQLEAVRGGGI